VAGFIGSPAMNFFDGRLEGTEQGLQARLADGTALPVPAARAEAYGTYRDQSITLGLRPEHLTASPGKPGSAPLTVVVDVVEPLGIEVLVYFSLGGELYCARLDADARVTPGEAVQLWADMNHMHLIDPTSGRVVY
jgi:multiple sugar transport system ATP-binding protein